MVVECHAASAGLRSRSRCSRSEGIECCPCSFDPFQLGGCLSQFPFFLGGSALDLGQFGQCGIDPAPGGFCLGSLQETENKAR